MAKTDAFGYALMERLQNRELVVPYLESSLANENWPDSYTVEVDSSPYTGNADGWFHPSSHPLEEERFLYLTIHPDTKDLGIQERKTLQSSMTLAMGSALHAVVQTQLVMSNLCREEDIEVPVRNEEHNFRGNMDARIRHPNGKVYGFEMKTQNSIAFDREKEPKPFWVAQINMYMYDQGLDEAVVLVLESGFPYRMKEFRVKKDMELINSILDKWDRVLEKVKRNEEPKFCCSLGSPRMNNCPFRRVCWGEDVV